MIPKCSDDRVTTNRWDSVTLTKLLRADVLRAIWIPDTAHEAVRDLTRSREMAMIDRKKSVNGCCHSYAAVAAGAGRIG